MQKLKPLETFIINQIKEELKTQAKSLIPKIPSSLSANFNKTEPVQQAIQLIKSKMSLVKMEELQPQYLSKTLSKFRRESLVAIKKTVHPLINSKEDQKFKEGNSVINKFITSFDDQFLDVYLQSCRSPYMHRIFNQSYLLPDLNIPMLSEKYSLHSKISSLLNSTSEWLLQIELTQDLLSRCEVYYDIKVPIIGEEVKKNTIQSGRDGSWAQKIKIMIEGVVASFLRKGCTGLQSVYIGLAPSAIMLTMAIVGGTSSLPVAIDFDMKSVIGGSVVAIAIPFMLQTLASTLQQAQFGTMLLEWTVTFNKIGENVRKFNQQLESTLRACSQCETVSGFQKQLTNLKKIVQMLKKNIKAIGQFEEGKFQQIRERTEAYFGQWIEEKSGEWTVVTFKQEENSTTSKR